MAKTKADVTLAGSCAARRRLCGVMILGLLAGAVAATAPAEALAPSPVFAPFVSYDAGKAKGVATGDFTGDGRNDVLVSLTDAPDTARPDRLYLFGQGPGGTLTRVDVVETSSGWIPDSGIAAGDFDGDGRTDAAVVSGETIDLLLQQGGGLSDGRAIPNPGFRWLETADLNGDGRLDIAGTGWGGVGVLRNTGGANFAAVEWLSGNAQVDLQVDDVTGDGRPDVVACGSSVLVFAGIAGGGFAAQKKYPTPHGRCFSLALADVNGDGRTDVSYVWSVSNPGRLAVLPQQANGTLGGAHGYPAYDSPAAVRAADMNADGRSDLVVLHEYTSRVGIHAQGPDRTLDPERTYPTPRVESPTPSALAVGDVNGDGRPDIAVVGNQHGLAVLLARPAGPSTTTSTSMLPPASPFGLPTSSRHELFGGTQTYGLGAPSESVVTGDFDGDGRTDVAAVTESGGSPEDSMKLFVLYQGADGSLSRKVKFDTDALLGNGGSVGDLTLAAGDLDGDGRDDLVLKMAEAIDIFLQRSGGFADRIYREVQLGSRADIVDLDGDGKGDLVISGSGIRLYRSLGAAEFAPPVTIDHLTNTREMAFGDVSGDGRPDIVTYSDYSDSVGLYGTVAVYRQRLDHSFEAAVRTDAGGRYGTVAVGDFNGDGSLDVAVSHSVNGGGTAEKIRILARGADGALAPVDELDQARDVGPLRAGDLNGDGLTDLLALTNGGYLDAWVQTGGHLEGYDRYFLKAMSGYETTALALADFSGDGRLDAAVASHMHGLEVKRNVTTEGAFHPLAPARILDTRIGVGAPAAGLGPNQTIRMKVTGAGGVPVGSATSVVLNVTVTEPTAGSYLTAWPAGQPRPLASNLNWLAGQTVPNLVTVRLGEDGKVDLYNSSGTTHVIADVAGWYGTDYADAGTRYTPVTPARVLDTRTGNGALTGRLGPSATLGLQVTGRGGVPASGASAVVLNVTVTEPTAGSFLTAWPAGQPRPLASNLNFLAGQTVPNLVVVKVGAGGSVNLYNLAGATHVIADVAGWFGAGPLAPTGSFSAVGPTRIADTRNYIGGKVGPGGTLTVKAIDRAGVPPLGVTAVVLNVTVTEPTTGSFLTVWPRGEARPLASNLNYEAGRTVANLVVVKVGAHGEVDLFNFAGAAHVVVDLAGWYRA